MAYLALQRMMRRRSWLRQMHCKECRVAAAPAGFVPNSARRLARRAVHVRPGRPRNCAAHWKNSAISGAVAAAPGKVVTPSPSKVSRSVLSCW